MKNVNKKLILLLIVCLVGAISLDSCKKKKDGPKPELPPTTTMEMDFSDFPQAKSLLGVQDTSNKGLGVINVAFWHTMLTVTLWLPVAAFKAAFTQTPVAQEDGSWEWSYNVLGATVKLNGKVESSTVYWNMYVNSFLWYKGTHNTSLTAGTWTFYKSQNENHEILGITWNRNTSNNTFDIEYKNIEVGAAEYGGYIKYGWTTDATYNAYYDIYNKGQDNLTNVKWNRTTKEGSIKDPKFFLDSDWHCWNSAGANIVCPQ